MFDHLHLCLTDKVHGQIALIGLYIFLILASASLQVLGNLYRDILTELYKIYQTCNKTSQTHTRLAMAKQESTLNLVTYLIRCCQQAQDMHIC